MAKAISKTRKAPKRRKNKKRPDRTIANVSEKKGID